MVDSGSVEEKLAKVVLFHFLLRHRTDKFSKARQGIWQQLSDRARNQFAGPPPGNSHRDDDPFSNVTNVSDQTPLDDFCLLLLDPEEIDHLDLTSNERHRYFADSAGGSWQHERINP